MSDTVQSPSHPVSHRLGLTCVFFAGVLWSTVGLGIRLIDEATVWQILLYRSISLTIFLYFVIWFRTKKSPLHQLRSAGWPAAVGGLSLVAAYSGGIYALQTTSVANAMLLFASSPFLAALFGWGILRERVRRGTWVAMAAAVLGIALMVADKSGGGQMVGNLAGLFSAAGFAAFTVALRWGKSGDMMPAVFLSGIFAIIITTAACLLLGLSLVLTVNDGAISLSMGTFQVGAGLVLYTLGSKTVPAVELTLLSMSEVLLGPLWVWLLLGETVSPNTLFGGLILLIAIAGNAMSGMRRKPVTVR